MHPGTERKIKEPIEKLFRESELAALLQPASASSAREFQLPGTRYRADFAFRMQSGGWFFIEDDDGQRCLGNFIKYWQWVEKQSSSLPVSLVHLVGPPGPGQQELLKFVHEKARDRMRTFRFALVETKTWETTTWINDFRSKVLSLPPFGES